MDFNKFKLEFKLAGAPYILVFISIICFQVVCSRIKVMLLLHCVPLRFELFDTRVESCLHHVLRPFESCLGKSSSLGGEKVPLLEREAQRVKQGLIVG